VQTQPPPLQQPMNDTTGRASRPWSIWFQGVAQFVSSIINYQTVQTIAVPVTQEVALNFLSPFIVTDNPANKSTDISLPASPAIVPPVLYIVTGSRSINTLYQNTTGKTMIVHVSYSQPSSGTVTLYSGNTSFLGTTQVVDIHGGSGGTGSRNVSCTVPPNSYYSFITDTAGSLVVCTETY